MMTLEEEAEYINKLLPLMAQRPAGYDISHFTGRADNQPLHIQQYAALARRLVTEQLAIQNSPEFTFYLSIATLGKEVAEGDNGYLGHLTRLAKERQWAKLQALLATSSTVISALAAVVAVGVSIWLNNSLDKTNAQVEAQNKRIQALETQLKQRTQQGNN
jgi:hypothetical protein